MSWKVRFIKLDHVQIYSIYRFTSRLEAERYLDWIYQNQAKRDDTAITESEETANVRLDENMIWRWIK